MGRAGRVAEVGRAYAGSGGGGGEECFDKDGGCQAPTSSCITRELVLFASRAPPLDSFRVHITVLTGIPEPPRENLAVRCQTLPIRFQYIY